jgi:sugar phosphate isomerase/epimerase
MSNSIFTEKEISDRMSISTLVYWYYRPLCEESLAELAANGFTRIELLESPEQFDFTRKDSMSNIRRYCKNTGVEIGAYHAHFINFSGLDTEEKIIKRIDECKRQIDTMLETGSQFWGCHAQAPDSAMTRCIEELVKYVENTPAVIGIENFVREDVWVEKRVEYIKNFNHPKLRMILDIGHVRDVYGNNPMTLDGGPEKIISLCGSVLSHIHLHGFVNGVDHFPPFAEGDGIKWKELFVSLKKENYKGFFNFEPKGEKYHRNTVAITKDAPGKIAKLLS